MGHRGDRPYTGGEEGGQKGVSRMRVSLLSLSVSSRVSVSHIPELRSLVDNLVGSAGVVSVLSTKLGRSRLRGSLSSRIRYSSQAA